VAGNDQVDFALKLIDDASRPAQAAENALKGVRKELSEVEKAEKKANEAHKAHSEAMGRVGEASSKASADLLSFAVSAGAAVAATAVAMVLAAEKWALEASEFQSKSLMALEAIDGTSKGAKDTLDELRGAANKAGLGTEKVTEFYKALRLAGVSVEDTKNIMAAGLDMSAVFGDQAGSGVIEAIKGLQEKGKLTTETLGALKGAQLGDSGKFYEVLAGLEGANTFGKTKTQIEAMLKANQIDADTGTQAILKLVSDKADHGGPVGTAAAAAGNTVGGQLQALKNQMNSVFADSAVTAPFLDALKSINKLLDPTTESGQKIRATLGRAFQAVADAMSKITPEDIEKVLNAAIDLAGVVMDLAKSFKDGLGKSLTKALEPFSKLLDGSSGSADSLKLLADVLGLVAEGVGWLAGAMIGTFTQGIGFILSIPSKLQGLGDAFADIWDSIPKSWEALEEWWDGIDLYDIGSDIVDGLWEGIKQGWKDMLDAVAGLLDLLPAAAKKALGIASPSKIFAEIGGFVGEGFAVGVEAENDNAQTAVEELVTPPAMPSISGGAPSGAVAGGGGRGGVTIENLSISLQVTGGDVSDGNAQRFAREFAREFQRTVEGFADETGSLDSDVAAAA
jgi:hypothetical protein